MYILDTDHLSVLERGGAKAQRLSARLETIPPTQIVTSIISYQEQLKGWLARINTQDIEQQVKAYRGLRQQLAHYCEIPILEFDRKAAEEFQRLKQLHPTRIGTMDLKIASIALANQAVVLTRNVRDFGRVSGLSTEDWTT